MKKTGETLYIRESVFGQYHSERVVYLTEDGQKVVKYYGRLRPVSYFSGWSYIRKDRAL